MSALALDLKHEWRSCHQAAIADCLEESHVKLEAGDRERVPHDLGQLLLWAAEHVPHLHAVQTTVYAEQKTENVIKCRWRLEWPGEHCRD